MKTLLALALTLSFSVAMAASNADLARQCHQDIGEHALNNLMEKGAEKKSVKAQIQDLKERLEATSAIETGCNEETEMGSDERQECYVAIYLEDAKELAKEYSVTAKQKSQSSACKGLL
jgi:uncharacterized protein YigA (DUF484 family)